MINLFIKLFCALGLLFVFSCGFKLEVDKQNNDDDNSPISIKYDRISCFSPDYSMCKYFKERYSQSISSYFNGLVEIIVKDSINNTYSNFGSDVMPRVGQTSIIIEYTIVSNVQMDQKNKGILTGSLFFETPYQFGSTVIGDLYSQKKSKEVAIENVIEIINHATKSLSNEYDLKLDNQSS